MNAAIKNVRAAGVFIETRGATPFVLNWTASITLNPSGPSYATLQNDPAPIEITMESYLDNLAITDGFNRALARQAILAIWGPAGTNDITDFVNVTPSGDVAGSVSPPTKIIPGTVEIV